MDEARTERLLRRSMLVEGDRGSNPEAVVVVTADRTTNNQGCPSASFFCHHLPSKPESLLTKIFAESDITIDTLVAHIRDSGLVPHEVQPDGIWIRSPKGLGFRISIIEDRKFIRVSTFLPLNRLAPIDRKHGLTRRLNENVFLPTFTIDQDGDLTIMYVLPYEHGLIAGNFVALINRFGSMLEYVVQSNNQDGLIDFGAPGAVLATTEGESGTTGSKLLH
ncbi:YbjN domain-containing protein [Ralstonia sp. 22111]|uniref:YbjN domain-containing protein n=1 Tax=Ralstonia sp. 22111 TaxID=3453878 RepID=UPI003F82B9B5